MTETFGALSMGDVVFMLKDILAVEEVMDPDPQRDRIVAHLKHILQTAESLGYSE